MGAYGDYLMTRYQGEVLGEALFAGLAERTKDADERRKWRVLERLEWRTKERIRPALERLGLETIEDAEQRRRGGRLAERLGGVAWLELMARIRPELEKLVAEFRAAEALAPPGEEELARYVTNHERALLEFVELKLSQHGNRSLDPIEKLLG